MKRPWIAVAAALFLLAAVAVHVARLQRGLSVPIALAEARYVGSKQCLSCHPVHYASWYRTFHRTMTQDAGEHSVLGDFDGASYTYEGIPSRFFRGPEGEYLIETAGPDGTPRQFRVVRTVGSRRVQQYVTRIEGKHLRLPLAWNVEEKRWFHLNGGFLDPDGMPFHRHTAAWDANCIFCHNVKAKPGFDRATRRFESTVAELGIACEACHGPGEKHAASNRNPLRRYLLHYSGRHDPTILSPLELPKERQVQICGHCHGQRLPEPRTRIRDFITTGDPYTPGDDLGRITKPIDMATTLPGVDLSLRFWKDGTPRLTAYEYQGLLMSPDYQKGQLTCLSCHTMHGGDPRGMIAPAMRGEAACASCHSAIVNDVAAHTRHKASGAGSDCYACHMPKITYGLLDVHPTHRIQRPDPARAWRHDMPEACTLCHTNRTARWAAETMARDFRTPLPADLPAGADFDVAENVRQLLAGDVVQRSVAVMALTAENTYTDDANARLWVVPLLLVTMDDDYAAVRHFAYRGLGTLVRDAATRVFPPFDPQAPPEARRRAIDAWRAWWLQRDKRDIPHPGSAVPLDAALEPDLAVISRLREKQHDRMISIGE